MDDEVFYWDDSVSYNVDNTVRYNNKFYDCIKECINIVPGQDDNSKFYWKAWDYLLGPDENEITDEDDDNDDDDDNIDDLDLTNTVVSNDEEEPDDSENLSEDALISLKVVNDVINAYIAPLYSSSAIYSTGDIVCYEGHLYRRKDNITYVAGPWNSENWDQIGDLQTQIKNINNNLNNYVQTSVLNNYLQKTDLKYENFLNDWLMTTFSDFCLSLITFSANSNNIGRVFLGDFPSSWIPDIPKEGRAVIEILNENYIHLILYTNDLHKYEYLFDDTNNSGWF